MEDSGSLSTDVLRLSPHGALAVEHVVHTLCTAITTHADLSHDNLHTLKTRQSTPIPLNHANATWNGFRAFWPKVS